MKRFRVTVAAGMAGIAYLGFALATLKGPTALWVESWLTANLAALAVAVPGAIYSKGRRKVFWGGFALVGGGFLALNLFPAQPLRWPTRSPAQAYYRTLSYDPGRSEDFVWAPMGGGYQRWRLGPALPGDRKGMYRVSTYLEQTGSSISGMFPASALRPIGPDEFLLLCHLIFAPVLALAGSGVALAFAAHADSGDGPSAGGSNGAE